MTVIKTLSPEELPVSWGPQTGKWAAGGKPGEAWFQEGCFQDSLPVARCHLGQSIRRPVAHVRICRVRKKSKGDPSVASSGEWPDLTEAL